MLRCNKNSNHSSFKAPSIVQIPKPLQKCKKYRQNSNRIKTVGYDENYYGEHCLWTGRASPEDRKIVYEEFRVPLLSPENLSLTCVANNRAEWVEHCVKLQTCQIIQPEGDVSGSPILSYSQVKQSLSCSLSLPTDIHRQHKKVRVSSNARLKQKAKPSLTSRSNTVLQGSIILQNQILRIENEKLKHLSEVRKNQIQILLKQILQLKADLSNIFDESELESNQFHEIERSLNLSPGANRKQPRSAIAKDIYKRLREVLGCQLEEGQPREEGAKLIHFQQFSY